MSFGVFCWLILAFVGFGRFGWQARGSFIGFGCFVDMRSRVLSGVGCIDWQGGGFKEFLGLLMPVLCAVMWV